MAVSPKLSFYCEKLRLAERPLILAGDKLNKYMCPVPIDWDVVDLIDDQELRLAVELDPLLDPVFGIGLGYRSDQGHRPGEVGPVALSDNFHAQGHGLVSRFDA